MVIWPSFENKNDRHITCVISNNVKWDYRQLTSYHINDGLTSYHINVKWDYPIKKALYLPYHWHEGFEM